MDPSTQIHDFNTGFQDPVNPQGDRTVWIAAIPDSDVQVSNLLAGRAEMHVHNLAVEDYFDIANASAVGPEVDALVSFDVVWDGPVTRRVNVNDAANDFRGNFFENQATVIWSGSNELGFQFFGDPGDFSTTDPARAFAEIGHDWNGIFFPSSLGADATPQQPVQQTLTSEQLQPVVQEAITSWQAAGARAAQGHGLGLEHSKDGNDVTAATLAPGVRRLPTASDLGADVVQATAAPTASAAGLPVVSGLASVAGTSSDQGVAVVSGSLVFGPTQTPATPAGSGQPAPTSVSAPFAAQPPLLPAAGSQSPATGLPLTPRLQTSTTALLDQVFVTVAAKPLDRDVFNDLLLP